MVGVGIGVFVGSSPGGAEVSGGGADEVVGVFVAEGETTGSSDVPHAGKRSAVISRNNPTFEYMEIGKLFS